ncbi:MAG: CPBP family intramembrane metalloprotease [Chitinophagaceae bacterium]|nr:CPBP family intramembrane metalloprotease [Chitinophagaceae bacterium]
MNLSRNLPEKQKIVIYCVLVLAFAVVFSLINSPLTLGAYMFIPSIVTLIMLFIVTKDGKSKDAWRQIGFGVSWKYLAYAFVIPSVVLLTSYLIAYLINPDFFIGYPKGEKINHLLYPFLPIIIFSVLQTVTLSLGEELGWRGYLLPKLIAHTSSRLKAHLIVGLIWALWHFPLIFIARAYNTEGNIVITTILFVAVVCFLSIIIGELKMRSNSVWTASLFHSVHNTVWGYISPLFITGAPLIYWSGESGIITIILYAIAAVLLLKFKPKQFKPDAQLSV